MNDSHIPCMVQLQAIIKCLVANRFLDKVRASNDLFGFNPALLFFIVIGCILDFDIGLTAFKLLLRIHSV